MHPPLPRGNGEPSLYSRCFSPLVCTADSHPSEFAFSCLIYFISHERAT